MPNCLSRPTGPSPTIDDAEVAAGAKAPENEAAVKSPNVMGTAIRWLVNAARDCAIASPSMFPAPAAQAKGGKRIVSSHETASHHWSDHRQGEPAVDRSLGAARVGLTDNHQDEPLPVPLGASRATAGDRSALATDPSSNACARDLASGSISRALRRDDLGASF